MNKKMIETPGTVSIRFLSKKEKRIIKQSFISKILFYVIIFAIFIKNIIYIDFNQIQNADVHNLIKTLCFVLPWGLVLIFFFCSFYFPYKKRGVKWIVLELFLFGVFEIYSIFNLFNNKEHHILFRVIEPFFYFLLICFSYLLLKANLASRRSYQ